MKPLSDPEVYLVVTWTRETGDAIEVYAERDQAIAHAKLMLEMIASREMIHADQIHYEPVGREIWSAEAPGVDIHVRPATVKGLARNEREAVIPLHDPKIMLP